MTDADLEPMERLANAVIAKWEGGGSVRKWEEQCANDTLALIAEVRRLRTDLCVSNANLGSVLKYEALKRRREEEELARLPIEEQHAQFAHPDYEYEITEGPRKAWYDENVPPNGDATWERNIHAGENGWARFEYTESAYWMRRKVAAPPACEVMKHTNPPVVIFNGGGRQP